MQFFAAGHTGREGSQRVTCGVGESPPRTGGTAAEDKTTEWTRASPAQRSGRGEHAGGAYHGTPQGHRRPWRRSRGDRRPWLGGTPTPPSRQPRGPLEPAVADRTHRCTAPLKRAYLGRGACNVMHVTSPAPPVSHRQTARKVRVHRPTALSSASEGDAHPAPIGMVILSHSPRRPESARRCGL